MGTLNEGGNYADLEGGLYVSAAELRRGHNTGDVKTVIGDREAGFGTQSPPKRQTSGQKESFAPVDPAAPDT